MMARSGTSAGGRRRRRRTGNHGQPRVHRAALGGRYTVSAAFSGAQALWFVSRGSGLALLAAFSAVVVLGAAARTGPAPGRWSRLAVGELHRTLALFCVAFLGLHVLTAILDPYVTIGWAATVLPFASPYRTQAIGLGTLAVDLGGAVLITSVARRRLGYRAWRAVHWLAYVSWPLAVGPRIRLRHRQRHQPGPRPLDLLSIGVVALAVGWRLLGKPTAIPTARPRPRPSSGFAARTSPTLGESGSPPMSMILKIDSPVAPGRPLKRAYSDDRAPAPAPARRAPHQTLLSTPPTSTTTDLSLSIFGLPSLIDEVSRSGLRGRGGAGFPTGRKMAAVARVRRPWRWSSPTAPKASPPAARTRC